MKFLHVHNEYGKISGEEIMISRITELLKNNGHQVTTYFRNSSEIKSIAAKFRAFCTGIYSRESRRRFREIVEQDRPDIIQIQNLYPLISPSILVEARRQNIPVVMRCSNYRLVCPNGLFMTKGRVCEKCAGGREWWCLLRNCERSLFKSFGYALRNYYARVKRLYLDNVTVYYAQTKFQRETLVRNGFDPERVSVIPNMIDPAVDSKEIGEYVGFVGRVSPEKGVGDLVSVAKQLTDIEFKAAGSCDSMPELSNSAPGNFELCGHVGRDKISSFFDHARMSVVCSIWYEGFPGSVIEAMMHGKPVIASRIGGIPEIIDDGVTGLLFEPGNADDLAEKVRYLWERPKLCRQMGQAGREKVMREYSPERYYERLMAVYKRAIELGPGGPGVSAN